MNTPRAVDVVKVVLSAAGLGVSVYLTAVHYSTAVPLACVETGAVNCAQVLTSPQSTWFGVPVSAAGVLWFGVTLALSLLQLRGRHGPPWMTPFGLTWALGGAVVVLYFVYVELIVIGKLCLWCTVAHVLALALFVLMTATARSRSAPVDEEVPA